MQNYAVTIDYRFRGPPDSANGGYSCGLLARYIPGSAEITLHRPPPLDRELRLRVDGDDVRLFDGHHLVAEGRSADLDLEAPPPVSIKDAAEASRRYSGFEQHVFPTCFVCGPERKPEDGLRIFAGRLHAEGAVAAPWVPSESLAGPHGLVNEVFVWAALDCPGAFAIEAKGKLQLLGRMIGRVDREVRVGEPYVVAAWPLGSQGRKYFAGSAVFSEDGGLCAIAKATWIEVG